MEKKKNVMLLLLITCSFVACLAMSSTSFTDEEALLAFKAHITFDPSNVLATNWSQGTSFCNWIGVSCSRRRQRVTALNLPNMGLRGTIPKEVGNLSFLSFLDVSENSFHGHLPDELGGLRRLKSINFRLNEFTGKIPSSFGILTKLEFLLLSYNNFTGSIPRGIGFLPELKLLYIRNNSLSGSIPSTIFNISSLQKIDLTFNELSGTLPMDMCNNLSKLEALHLSFNQLGGELPTSLPKCTQLQNISLSVNEFTGQIPREIGNLSKLQLLYLGGNSLTGTISSSVGELPDTVLNFSSLVVFDVAKNAISGGLPKGLCQRNPRLEVINLASNQLAGNLSSWLSNCKQLKKLYLLINNFTGSMPVNIGNNSTLQVLHLYRNNLEGEIPLSIGNMSALEDIDVSENNFHGIIPWQLGNLPNLIALSLGSNNLMGEIPRSLFNITNLQDLSLSINQLSGNLPSSAGLWLLNLRTLFLGGNKLSGIIPNSISNASQLVEISLSHNLFTGSIPTTLGTIDHLQSLDLGSNQLKNDPSSTLELSFLTSLTNCRLLDVLVIQYNPLNGILPKSIGNFSDSLEIFYASACQIKGIIPIEIGNLSNLISLTLGGGNDLTGSIPETFGQLLKLQFLEIAGTKLQGEITDRLCALTSLSELELNGNKFSGSIPSCIGNLTSLRRLFLDTNALTSEIPSTLWNLQDILIMTLSSNSLTGSLPPEIGNLKHVTLLDLSKNQFTGKIPNTIGQLQNLVNLSLSENRLQGPIPESFSDLISLESLDLSRNSFSGAIPKSLEKLLYLKYINVSFNRLSGEIPSGGPFANFTYESFVQNDGLCGAPRFHVRKCRSPKKSRKTEILLKYIVPPIASVVVAMAFLVGLLRCKKKSRQLPIQCDSPPGGTHRRISHQEILYSTNYFSEDNLIGKGGIGSVYKGLFTDGMVAAVKVFNLEQQGAFKSFDAECQVMRNIRHRNLVKIISSCSNLDFKALVLEYMPNGNLDRWLYSHNYCLNIVQRLCIMIDVASALEYLHHSCSTPVVHCDLKPSNILLDEDMVAHVGDFGIAKLLMENQSMAQTKTIGTIGYMAPEYGSAGMVSVMVDVYSYGILLMETFTRKKPTDDIFLGELSLKHWVRESFPSDILEVVDANLLRGAEENFAAMKNCLSALLGLALERTADLPEERVNMNNVLARVKKIKIMFLENVTRPGMKPLI
ncbi:probable LRR receptor-like serine/threonine-protein kinase At3g47570 [Cornus florida]|uniref:probable LRR receptor-like serine/threonine-protein kinase At3g47570 n=1 Tax=Cornus florida TaxID=4283 RepID=UPI00289DF558|nr:probable LRR receptor-like serine/threonine-protein kinase At3g47570 [Cornus florida]